MYKRQHEDYSVSGEGSEDRTQQVLVGIQNNSSFHNWHSSSRNVVSKEDPNQVAGIETCRCFETIADFDIDTARQKDAEQKQKGKNHSDERRGVVFSDIKPGDKVLLQQQQSNKLPLPYNPGLFTVADRHGPEVIVKSQDGTTYRRNVAHVKKYV